MFGLTNTASYILSLHTSLGITPEGLTSVGLAYQFGYLTSGCAYTSSSPPGAADSVCQASQCPHSVILLQQRGTRGLRKEGTGGTPSKNSNGGASTRGMTIKQSSAVQSRHAQKYRRQSYLFLNKETNLKNAVWPIQVMFSANQ